MRRELGPVNYIFMGPTTSFEKRVLLCVNSQFVQECLLGWFLRLLATNLLNVRYNTSSVNVIAQSQTLPACPQGVAHHNESLFSNLHSDVSVVTSHSGRNDAGFAQYRGFVYITRTDAID